jgi:polysaccharide export outer membrane protein
MAEWKRRFFLRRALFLLVVLSCVIFCCAILQAQNLSTPDAMQSVPSPTPATSSQAVPFSAATLSAAPLMTSSNMRLGVNDLIQVNVFGVPDLTTKTRIGRSGDIYLPLVNYVHVADLTTNEAQDLIAKRLEDGGFVRQPHVTISVEESSLQAITLIGEVVHPGPYPPNGDRHLLDLISAAGGLTDKAGHTVTIVHRGDPNNRVELQISKNLAEDAESNVEILPGDTIIVSRGGIVYVVGDVGHPSGFFIEDSSLTVLKALALAGGSTRTSNLNKTKIIRQTPNGAQEIPVQLKKILYAKAPDVLLIKGDVLFVPGNSAKAAAYRTGDIAMAVSTALAVVAVH